LKGTSEESRKEKKEKRILNLTVIERNNCRIKKRKERKEKVTWA